MASDQQQIIKCVFVDKKDNSKEIRKFVLNKNDSSKFKVVSKKIRALFPQIGGSEYRVFYIDEEGDKITVSSDEELSVAYFTVGTSPAARLSVELLTPKEPVTNQGTFEFGSCKGEVHKGVICDVCDSEIRGFRYKCIKCPDYDLCGKCEAAGHHPGHKMLRLSGPMDHFPRILKAVRSEGGSWVGRENVTRPSLNRSPRTGSSEGPAPKCQASSQRSFSCRPESTLRTNQETKPSCDLLKNVGHTIASFLEPLGIDVHVDVHTEGENVHCAPFQDSTAPTANNIPADHFQAAAAAAEKAAAALAAAEQAINAVESVKKQTVVEPTGLKPEPVELKPEPVEPNPEPVELKTDEEPEVPEQSVEPPADTTDSKEVADSSSSGSESGDWLVVNRQKSADQVTEKEPEAAAVDQEAIYPKLESLEPAHPNPVIAAALERMLAMGFTNEGGWLSQLLEVKGGDINKVMDILHGPF